MPLTTARGTRSGCGIGVRRLPLDRRDWQRFGQSGRLTNIAERLRTDRDMVHRAMITSGLDRSEQAYVYYLAGKKSEVGPDEYIAAFNLTSAVVVAPDIKRATSAFATTWSMDILESFYTSWWDEEIRPRDQAGFEASKAVMTIAAGMRSSAHIKLAHDELPEKPRLWALFSRLAAEGGRAVELREYSSHTRHLDRLARVVNERAPYYASLIAQELAALFPKAPVGRFLSADANLAAAWTRQRSGKVRGVFDPEREAWLTRRHRDARYRYYSHGPSGRADADDETTDTVKPGGRGVRGHLFTFCTDVSTQVALAVHASPADYFEPKSIEGLMPTIFEHWPEPAPFEYLVADKLWHKRPTHKELVLRWGIHLVAIPAAAALKLVQELDPLKHRVGVATIRGDGLVTCREHGQPCKFVRVETPSRELRKKAGLEPGDWAPPGKFRYRVECERGCGRLNLPMSLDYIHRGLISPDFAEEQLRLPAAV